MTPSQVSPAHLEHPPSDRAWLTMRGVFALLASVVAFTMPAVVGAFGITLLGVLLLLTGVVEAVLAFRHRDRDDAFGRALLAGLALLAGVLMIARPLAGAISLIALLGAWLVATGVLRIAFATTERTPGWAWLAGSGVAALVLGLGLTFLSPVASVFLVGMLLGLDFLVDGVASLVAARHR